MTYEAKNSPVYSADWTRDGRHVLVRLGSKLFALASGATTPIPIVHVAGRQSQPQLSPDNRYLAYVSLDGGQRDVFVQPFALDGKPGAQRWQVSSTEGGADPRWSPDGRELFYVSGDQKLMSVRVTAESAFDPPTALFDMPTLTAPITESGFRFAVAPDGKRFLMLKNAANAAPLPLTVVTNWRKAVRE